jgi:hypothetical protein
MGDSERNCICMKKKGPGNLHYDLPPYNFKSGNKKRMDQNKDSMRIRKQPTRMLISAHLISIEIEQHSGENG